MKTRLCLLIAFILIGSTLLIAQDEISATANETERAETGTDLSTIIVYRGGQFFGSAINYSIFADGEKVCKLSNKKYIEFQHPPGKVQLNAKRGGVEAFKKTTGFTVEAEAGQTYYIRCDVKSSFTRTRLEMSEVTKSTANRDMVDMTKDKCQEGN